MADLGYFSSLMFSDEERESLSEIEEDLEGEFSQVPISTPNLGAHLQVPLRPQHFSGVLLHLPTAIGALLRHNFSSTCCMITSSMQADNPSGQRTGITCESTWLQSSLSNRFERGCI